MLWVGINYGNIVVYLKIQPITAPKMFSGNHGAAWSRPITNKINRKHE